MKSCIDSLNFMELFIILVTIFYIVNLILTLSLNYFVNVELLLLNSEYSDLRFMLMNEETGMQLSSTSNPTDTSSNPSPTTSSTNESTTTSSSNPNNIKSTNSNPTTISTNESTTNSSTNNAPISHVPGGGLMPSAMVVGGAGMVAGMKAAASSPTLAGKLGWVAGGVLAGGGSIITTSIAQILGEEIVKSPPKNYIGDSSLENLKESLDLTGNNAIDLLLMIQTFQKLQLFFLFVIAYNLILVSLNEEKVEIKLLQKLPVRIVSFIIKYFKSVKKSIRIIIFCFFIILVICNIQSYYYLNFFIENLDGIIESYFKK